MSAPLNVTVIRPQGWGFLPLVWGERGKTVARPVEVLPLAGLEPTVVDLKSFSALQALRGNLQGQHQAGTRG
ncbi:hypothetical protein [Deinococcus hopiensis]|uniref:hypothetical protein n=1 Tax=Deinococcus hopiensis TaxID=309885 RepID=UPI0009FC61E0|nr:hypothetical protein [Deinococcus hopiensis]